MVVSTERDERSVLAKAFRILDVCAAARWQLTVGQLARAAGLPKSTTHRLVTQLIDWGALERDGQGILLGARLFELGACVSHARVLRQAALPYIGDLYEATRQIVHLGVLDDAEILYIDKICGRRRAAVPTRVGGRMPAACTALGKAILASSPPDVVDRVMARGLNARTTRTVADEKRFREELRKTAARGVAFEREEAYVGVACVAAPILNSHDHAVAAVSVTGPATTFDPERFADATRLSALAISRELVRSAAVQRDGAGLTLEPSVIPGS